MLKPRFCVSLSTGIHLSPKKVMNVEVEKDAKTKILC